MVVSYIYMYTWGHEEYTYIFIYISNEQCIKPPFGRGPCWLELPVRASDLCNPAFLGPGSFVSSRDPQKSPPKLEPDQTQQVHLIHLNLYMYVFTSVYMYMYMYMRIYIYMYTYIHVYAFRYRHRHRSRWWASFFSKAAAIRHMVIKLPGNPSEPQVSYKLEILYQAFCSPTEPNKSISYTYIYIYIQIHTCVHVCMYIFIYTYVHIYIYLSLSLSLALSLTYVQVHAHRPKRSRKDGSAASSPIARGNVLLLGGPGSKK